MLDNQSIDHLTKAIKPITVAPSAPSYKAVVKRALVDADYKRELLASLGIQN